MWRIGLHRPNREPRNVRVTPPKRFLEQADEPPTRRLDAAVRNLPARVVETRDTQLVPVNDHVDHRRQSWSPWRLSDALTGLSNGLTGQSKWHLVTGDTTGWIEFRRPGRPADVRPDLPVVAARTDSPVHPAEDGEDDADRKQNESENPEDADAEKPPEEQENDAEHDHKKPPGRFAHISQR
jgi:hypothetical protein